MQQKQRFTVKWSTSFLEPKTDGVKRLRERISTIFSKRLTKCYNERNRPAFFRCVSNWVICSVLIQKCLLLTLAIV